MRPGVDGSFDLIRGEIVFVPHKRPLRYVEPTTKVCRDCKVEKPLADFYVHQSAYLGRRPECADCARKASHTGNPPGRPRRKA